MVKSISLSLFLFIFSFMAISQNKNNQFDSDGKRDGIWSKKYPNGNIRYKGEFLKGKEVGTFKFYALTGEEHPVVIKTFNSSNTICDVQFFSNKAVLKSVGKMIEKKRMGSWNYFFGDGKTLLSVESYKDGLLDGELKIFYKSGKTAEIAHYKAGKLHGNTKRFSEEGKVYENLTYKNGIMHGPAIIYDKKGVVFAKGNYIDGIKSGIWYFNSNGEMLKVTPDKIRNK